MTHFESIIYLDNNATTQIDNRVLDAMLPFLKEGFANPSSTHYFGKTINETVKVARTQVADLIGADEKEIIFTGGSTEAINIALKGVSETYSNKGKHIITVSTEHKAVLDTCKYLENRGYEITYLPVQKNGLIELEELKNCLRSDTILVSVMFVNNETGVIQPISEIASIAHNAGALFMTDATQAVGKIELDVTNYNIDILCFSGHKMYAPKGIGVLYTKKGIKLPTYTHGGGHENQLRSGTLNVPSIIALGMACQIAKEEIKLDSERIGRLRDELENELLEISDTCINGTTKSRIYNVSNICFNGFDANVLIGRMKNVAVSNGSACTSAIFEPSHVLTSMGLNNDEAFASIRFSLGKFNTKDDIRSAIEIVKSEIKFMNSLTGVN